MSCCCHKPSGMCCSSDRFFHNDPFGHPSALLLERHCYSFDVFEGIVEDALVHSMMGDTDFT